MAMRRLLFLLVLLLVAPAATAQGFSGLARIDADGSRIADLDKGLRVELGLSVGVPWRLFTLDGPPRLVMDFQEVDWTGLDAERLARAERVKSVQFGAYRPGWSRMVIELAAPLGVDQAGMRVDPVTGAARLAIDLSPRSAQEFAAEAGAPRDPRWDLPEPAAIPRGYADRGPDGPLRVVIDPGHGGIDPGAERGAIAEKALTLAFARQLREELLRDDRFEVVLTRDADYFVSLERRVEIAHQAGADVFLSIHADSLSEGLAHGATVHVLAHEASDAASARLAERHDRDDLLAGADLSGADDRVTDVLLDLARQETQPRTEALARALIDGMTQVGGPINRKPLRWAAFSVLKAADIPSVLIEIGFMSSPRDLKNLQDAEWRARLARGIRNGLIAWREDDLGRKPLVRK
ncbi:N-acetylmuramoyl-L-alanine amidase [Jhaorihella thermophila]|uniref:N-acetylmuramoyl-L-alanine amidase n=2 Tax=Jhaorihella thermophila TaxID=488547 RepID=A0A1H5TBD9_9RHOB|nr:N-acetylmuramoyl-L-alanine amidase [Jhaorihella thermophila]